MTKKEKIADLKKRIAEWDRKRLGMEGLRLLKFELAILDMKTPLHDLYMKGEGVRVRNTLMDDDELTRNSIELNV